MGNLFCRVLTQGQRRRHVSAGGPALPSSFQSTRSPQRDIQQRLTTPLGAALSWFVVCYYYKGCSGKVFAQACTTYLFKARFCITTLLLFLKFIPRPTQVIMVTPLDRLPLTEADMEAQLG